MNLAYKIPAIPLSFSAYTPSVKAQIKNKVDSINASLGSVISNVSKITNVPVQLILSFGFIESSGNPNAVSPAGAVGFMGLKPQSANDVVVMENLSKRINTQEYMVLKKYLGTRFTEGILKQKYLGNKVKLNGVSSSNFITKEDLLNPELNILIGSMLIGRLVAEESKNGLRLDRVAYRYNQGYFAKLISGTPTELAQKSTATEGKNYILKLIGTNGVLDAIV